MFFWEGLGNLIEKFYMMASPTNFLLNSMVTLKSLAPREVHEDRVIMKKKRESEKDKKDKSSKLILPVDLAQERCLVTVFLTSLTPRALQVHSTDSLSGNLKNTQWRLCGRWRSDAQVSDKNTQKLRENMLYRTVL